MNQLETGFKVNFKKVIEVHRFKGAKEQSKIFDFIRKPRRIVKLNLNENEFLFC